VRNEHRSFRAVADAVGCREKKAGLALVPRLFRILVPTVAPHRIQSTMRVTITITRMRMNDYRTVIGYRIPGPGGDGEGKKLGWRRQEESRLNRVPRTAHESAKKTVCHELALKGGCAENQLVSIFAPKHEEGADTRN
jgi:hypothetical protein